MLEYQPGRIDRRDGGAEDAPQVLASLDQIGVGRPGRPRSVPRDARQVFSSSTSAEASRR
jgi:hypothetical protein